ncbi:MAG TPA: hypothetical protein VG860_23970 [Terriglobia bacterium]|nr:hypothetical protein [Terriglobia bacterium]
MALKRGIRPTDAPTFATVAALLGSVALAASYLPARRATILVPFFLKIAGEPLTLRRYVEPECIDDLSGVPGGDRLFERGLKAIGLRVTLLYQALERRKNRLAIWFNPTVGAPAPNISEDPLRVLVVIGY